MACLGGGSVAAGPVGFGVGDGDGDLGAAPPPIKSLTSL